MGVVAIDTAATGRSVPFAPIVHKSAPSTTRVLVIVAMKVVVMVMMMVGVAILSGSTVAVASEREFTLNHFVELLLEHLGGGSVENGIQCRVDGQQEDGHHGVHHLVHWIVYGERKKNVSYDQGYS